MTKTHSEVLMIRSFFIGVVILHQTAFASSLVIALPTLPSHFDPRKINQQIGRQISQPLIYETLITQDDTLQIASGLAASWESDPSQKAYTFKLNRQATFSDGSPVLAQDIQHVIEQFLTKTSPFFFLRTTIQSVSVIDSHTLRIDLYQPDSTFLFKMTLPIYKMVNQQPIGSGAFIIREHTAIELRLVPNAHAQKPPFLKEVMFQVIKDKQKLLQKLQKGEVDLALNQLSPAESQTLKKFRFTASPALNYQYIAINTQHPFLQQIQVRQALAYAIDRKKLRPSNGQSQAILADSLFPANTIFHSRNLKQYRHNLKLAKQLLQGKRFQLNYHTTQESTNLANALKQQLQKIGVTLVIHYEDDASLLGHVNRGDFDLALMRWKGVHDPSIYFSLFHSSQFPSQGGFNHTRFSHAILDNLLENQQSAPLKAHYDRVQSLLSQELPYLHLWHTQNSGVFKNSLLGFQTNLIGDYRSLKKLKKR